METCLKTTQQKAEPQVSKMIKYLKILNPAQRLNVPITVKGLSEQIVGAHQKLFLP